MAFGRSNKVKARKSRECFIKAFKCYVQGGRVFNRVGWKCNLPSDVENKLSSRDRSETKYPWYNLFRAVHEMRFGLV